MSSGNAFEDDPTLSRWARHVIDDMVPMVDSSTVCISLLPPRKEGTMGDVKYWVELGYLICANKPVMVVVMGDEEVPERLARAADEIVRLPEGVSPSGSAELAERMRAFAERFPEV